MSPPPDTWPKLPKWNFFIKIRWKINKKVIFRKIVRNEKKFFAWFWWKIIFFQKYNVIHVISADSRIVSFGSNILKKENFLNKTLRILCFCIQYEAYAEILSHQHNNSAVILYIGWIQSQFRDYYYTEVIYWGYYTEVILYFFI